MMGSPDFAKVLAEQALNSIPEGVLITALAWLVLQVVGRQNSGTRFAVWFFALGAIVAVPFLPAIPAAGTLARAVHAEWTLPGSWALAIVGIWGAIALLATARLIHGLWQLSSLRSQAEPVALSKMDPLLCTTVEECRRIRPVEIRLSAQIQVPTAIGFFQPVILIPEWTLEEFSTEELRAVVLHEFAHLRRRDDWTNLAQKIVGALFFFHPAVHWIEGRLSLEREMACDDLVLAQTRNPRVYARCLVSLAEKSFLRRTLGVAQAAIGRANQTWLRVAQILDVDRPKATRVFKPALAAITAFVTLCIFFVPPAPRLISFQDRASAGNLATLRDIESPQKLPKASVAPATAHLDRAQPLSTRGTRVETVRKPPAERERAIPVLAQAPAETITPAPQYLVITQATDYYQEGAAVIRVSVWRMTLLTVRQPASALNKAPNQT